jgi:hypothetical protein
LKVRIYWTNGVDNFICPIQFSEERKRIFDEYGDDDLLKRWCHQVLKFIRPAGETQVITKLERYDS